MAEWPGDTRDEPVIAAAGKPSGEWPPAAGVSAGDGPAGGGARGEVAFGIESVDGDSSNGGELVSVRARLLAGVLCAFAMTAVGPLLGLLWSVSAPRLDVEAVLAGATSVFGAQSTVDAYFAMICAVAGVVGGLIAWWRAADAGWPVPVGLGIGGIAGSLLAGRLGQWRRSGEVDASLPPNATDLLRDLAEFHVRATGLYLMMPGIALLVLALALWAGGTDPRRPRRRQLDPDEVL